MALPLAGAALMAGAGLMGGLTQNNSARRQAREANKLTYKMHQESQNFNRQEAEKNRAYQTEMSNSAYQRSTADMKKAGINPMLAYMQGGASTPAGGQGSISGQSGQQAAVEDAVGKGITSGMEAARYKKEMKQVDSNVDLQEQQKYLSRKQEELAGTTAFKEAKQANLYSEQIHTQRMENKRREEELKMLREVYKTEKDRARHNRRYVPIEAPMRLIQQGTNSASSLMRSGSAVRNSRTNRYNPRREGTFNKRTGEIYD